MRDPSYDMRPCDIGTVRELCERFHGYGGASNTATYAFAVYENGRAVAAYAWQPPPRGAALSVAPSAPGGVLALSRMVAVPRDQRRLNHVSKPLRRQMRALIDRTRWPALVTYSDEGQGHTGHVYKCSGWTPTKRSKAPVFETQDGVRVSSYSAGAHSTAGKRRVGHTWIQRWEHHASDTPREWMEGHGWERVPTGRVWRSGNAAHTWRKPPPQLAMFGDR